MTFRKDWPVPESSSTLFLFFIHGRKIESSSFLLFNTTKLHDQLDFIVAGFWLWNFSDNGKCYCTFKGLEQRKCVWSFSLYSRYLCSSCSRLDLSSWLICAWWSLPLSFRRPNSESTSWCKSNALATCPPARWLRSLSPETVTRNSSSWSATSYARPAVAQLLFTTCSVAKPLLLGEGRGGAKEVQDRQGEDLMWMVEKDITAVQLRVSEERVGGREMLWLTVLGSK